jgi:hypothetical protein
MIKHNSPSIKKMMGFGLGEHLPDLAPGKKINGVYNFSCNEWNGTKELQFKLQDFRFSDSVL